MRGCLFKDIHVAKLEALTMLANDQLKLNNAINTVLINLNSRIVGIFSFLIALWSAEKTQTTPFNKISLISSFAKNFNTLTKQNWYQEMLSHALNL